MQVISRGAPGTADSCNRLTTNHNIIFFHIQLRSMHVNCVQSVSMVNLDETVETMYPLMEPALESISAQIYETQSLDNITYEANNQYTTEVLLMAIEDALNQAKVEK